MELLENSPGRFLPFPTRYEIHDYHIMADFVRSLPAGKAQAELEAAICSKGAFRRFKSGIRYHLLEQRWYTYRAEAYHKIALRWCEEHGFIPTGAEGMQGAACRKAIPCMDKPVRPPAIAVPDAKEHPGLFLFILLLNAYCFRIRKV